MAQAPERSSVNAADFIDESYNHFSAKRSDVLKKIAVYRITDVELGQDLPRNPFARLDLHTSNAAGAHKEVRTQLEGLHQELGGYVEHNLNWLRGSIEE